jgi:hypothetical protein
LHFDELPSILRDLRQYKPLDILLSILHLATLDIFDEIYDETFGSGF